MRIKLLITFYMFVSALSFYAIILKKIIHINESRRDRDDLSAEETHEPQTLQRPHHHRGIQQALRPASQRTRAP